MRILFAGTPSVALPVLDRLAESDHQLVGVLTRPPAARGRSRRQQPSPVACWAADHQLPIISPSSLRDQSVARQLQALDIEVAVVVAYGGLIPRNLLQLLPAGWINLHFSLLPAYRGAAPVQQALLDGRDQTGVTTFKIVPALDAGPIFRQQAIKIDPSATAGDLLDELARLGADLMVETLSDLAAGAQPTAQPTVGVSLAPKIDGVAARLDLRSDSESVINRIRAMSPDPGAWAELIQHQTLLSADEAAAAKRTLPDDRGFKILRVGQMRSDLPTELACGDGDQAEAGALVASKRALWCRMGAAWVELTQVQAFGRRVMSGADWARGGWVSGMRLV
ncbi:MAG: methionyl-tRNA formyltransferase [Propionibacteriaceae bacterium]|jgi:methionyl-tRNA formyltransferase|nr:methionyl-tRNA formyltransferase [Propionibacteriaceae bacterium]